jgi:predicted kinase
VHVSSDYFVEQEAQRMDTTYSTVFKDYMPMAVSLMFNEVVEAINQGMDIVWDQTSTTISSRRKKLVMLHGYHKIAVVFKTPAPEELGRRLASRPGKNIPDHVVNSMISSFQLPSRDEGFDEIIHAN